MGHKRHEVVVLASRKVGEGTWVFSLHVTPVTGGDNTEPTLVRGDDKSCDRNPTAWTLECDHFIVDYGQHLHLQLPT